MAQPYIAFTTKEGSYFTASVAVVDMEVLARASRPICLAKSASSVLSCEHHFVILMGNAVLGLERFVAFDSGVV